MLYRNRSKGADGAHHNLLRYLSFTGFRGSFWGWSGSPSRRHFCELILHLFELETDFLNPLRCCVNKISSRRDMLSRPCINRCRRLILSLRQFFLKCHYVILGFVRNFEVGDDCAVCGGRCGWFQTRGCRGGVLWQGEIDGACTQLIPASFGFGEGERICSFVEGRKILEGEQTFPVGRVFELVLLELVLLEQLPLNHLLGK